MPFDTVINVSSWREKAPNGIGSNTQLNVTNLGTLPDGFRAGATDGSSKNVELNFSGHRAESVTLYAGSVANLSDGTVWGLLTANDGSLVNISGDVTLLNSFHAARGSTVNISGGLVHPYSAALEGSHINIMGGSVQDHFTAVRGSKVHLSGGVLGDAFLFRNGSELNIFGDNFSINGSQVDGMPQQGDSMGINLPRDAVLSGTLADGTPFAFSGQDGDQIADGVIVLSRIHVANAEPGSVVIDTESQLTGIRQGQGLTVKQGGILRQQFNAGSGSYINVDGGKVGAYFEAVNANVTVTSGFVGESFDAFYGSIVRISGGAVDANFDAMSGSVVEIAGGDIGPYFNAHAGSRVLIAGGSFGKGFRVLEGSSVEILGGEFAERFYVHDGGHVTIAGGNIGANFRGYDGSIINVRGTGFVLDGKPINGLVTGLPTLIADRDVILRGLLADGSAFEFELNSTDYDEKYSYSWGLPYDFFATGSVLSVTLIPEPAAIALIVSAWPAVIFISCPRRQQA